MSLIVIVDDRVTNRNIFAKLASSIDEDVTVRTFGDPAEALEWLVDHKPDLIITDYKMPSMDGADFVRCFREFPECSEIPVVVITVYEERAFRLKALEAGATDFLNSPVDHHEFVTRARNLLKLQKHQLLLVRRAKSLQQELEDSEKSREKVMRDSSERLAQVIDTLPIMINASNADSVVLFVNRFQAALVGLDATKLVGEPTSVLYGEEHAQHGTALDRMVFETGKALPAYEEEITDPQGNVRVFLTTKSPLRDHVSQITGVLTSSFDITSRKQTEAHLRHLAQHDALTDLPNRTLIRERLRQSVIKARRGSHHFALHMIDLDGFKSVNDLLGHLAGDRFIKTIAERLRGIIRQTDTLARLGGDEFAILQADVKTPKEASDFADRIIAAVSQANYFENTPINVSASVGIAMSATDGSTGEDLLRNSDLAMYRSKSEDGNRHSFFSADMNAHAHQNASLDSELIRAIEDNQFQLYYQPVVNLATGLIKGAEALLRWNRPGFGIVSPGAFLSRAEENGLIIKINEWVLREACQEARRWQDAKLPFLRVGVNLSAVQFRKCSVPLLVASILGETGLAPDRLDLELTESIMMQDMKAVAQDLRQLLDLGVHISMDDFGTGYSSLSYVKQLPIDRIKIDQSFIRTINTDPNDAAIVRAIIAMAHSLKLEVVAEGVETADQLARLRAEGCDQIQGYYFGKPMPANEFIARVRAEMSIAQSA